MACRNFTGVTCIKLKNPVLHEVTFINLFVCMNNNFCIIFILQLLTVCPLGVSYPTGEVVLERTVLCVFLCLNRNVRSLRNLNLKIGHIPLHLS